MHPPELLFSFTKSRNILRNTIRTADHLNDVWIGTGTRKRDGVKTGEGVIIRFGTVEIKIS